MHFFLPPTTTKNDVSGAVNWDTVVFFCDPATGRPVVADQKMVAPPKNPMGVDMGGLWAGKASSVECDQDKIRARGVPPLTFAEVNRIYEISAAKKISLGAAAIEVKGKDAFMPKVSAHFLSKARGLAYSWYEGCKSSDAPTSVSPMTPKSAQQARRKLLPTENGFAPAPA